MLQEGSHFVASFFTFFFFQSRVELEVHGVSLSTPGCRDKTECMFGTVTDMKKYTRTQMAEKQEQEEGWNLHD